MSARDPRVDAYLAALPADQQGLLEGVRATIRRVVPDAEETIAYDMPAFRLAGRFLVSYAGWKRHCSLYPLTDSFLAAHAAEIEGFGRTKGSIHFTAAKPLPPALLDELIRTRVADLAVEGSE
ncbi:MAG TPA: DUF1801 domain-containing protein [Patescibacteria group bacterium]|nr:DUF1801 domain-containing protein [Patescibacteria group bacterium]